MTLQTKVCWVSTTADASSAGLVLSSMVWITSSCRTRHLSSLIKMDRSLSLSWFVWTSLSREHIAISFTLGQTTVTDHPRSG